MNYKQWSANLADEVDRRSFPHFGLIKETNLPDDAPFDGAVPWSSPVGLGQIVNSRFQNDPGQTWILGGNHTGNNSAATAAVKENLILDRDWQLSEVIDHGQHGLL